MSRHFLYPDRKTNDHEKEVVMRPEIRHTLQKIDTADWKEIASVLGADADGGAPLI